MDYYLIVARSITLAQQMERALRREGIFPTIQRAPASISEQGCGYTLQVRAYELSLALGILRSAGLPLSSVITTAAYGYREVVI